ncbi:MAG TPA: amino acid permease, partial [Anaerolineae bacterium]|nr:amino acid permease [Anaerolineae bacterium]
AVLAAASLGTLVYYAVTNWAALRLARGQRLYPRVVPIAGLIGTVALAGSLPLQPLIVLAAVLAIGLAYFFLWHRWRRHRR